MPIVRARLTTSDNPFDPFDDYDPWYQWDLQAGYDSVNFLARLLVTSDELSDADQAIAVELTIDEIVKENVLGIYKKVTREDPMDWES